MSLEHKNEDQRLLTTVEAQDLIELFSEREETRRAEADRLAAMPKLSDVANLVGVSIEDLRPLLLRIRGDSPETAAIEADGDLRMTQREADRLLELHSQTEREREAELERRAQLTSLQDVADGLRIPVDDAEDLLKEVRRRREERQQALEGPPPGPLILIPTDRKTVERPESVYQATHDDGLRNVRLWAGGVLGLIALFALLTVLAKPSAPNQSWSTQPQQVFPQPGYGTTQWGPPGRIGAATPYRFVPVDPTSRPFVPATIMGSFPAPPKGWTVRVYDADGYGEVQSTATQALDPASRRAQLRESARGLLEATLPQPAAMNSVAVPTGAEPWIPFQAAQRSSDLSGSMIVQVSNGETVRRVYVSRSDVTGSPGASSPESELDARLDYLVGSGPGVAAARSAPKIESVTQIGCIPPRGTTVTVFTFGRAYQAVGGPPTAGAVDAKSCALGLERSIDNLLHYAGRKAGPGRPMTTPSGQQVLLVRDSQGRNRLVDAGYTVNIYNGYHAKALLASDYEEALRSVGESNIDGRPTPLVEAATQAANELARISRGR